MKWLALLALVVAGCSDPANTQYLPIGSRCSSSSQCGTTPFNCSISGFPNGYCDKPCTTDGDCPLDSLCGTALPRACRRVCMSTSDCRAAEGYTCQLLPTGKSVCDVATAAMDGGTR